MSDDDKALVKLLRKPRVGNDGIRRQPYKHERQAADRIEAQAAEIEKLREAVSILEAALQEVGDDYPGSKMQEWCQYMVSCVRAALGDPK